MKLSIPAVHHSNDSPSPAATGSGSRRLSNSTPSVAESHHFAGTKEDAAAATPSYFSPLKNLAVTPRTFGSRPLKQQHQQSDLTPSSPFAPLIDTQRTASPTECGGGEEATHSRRGSSSSSSSSAHLPAAAPLSCPPVPGLLSLPYVRQRRTAVSSESAGDFVVEDSWTPPVYPKTAEEHDLLARVVRSKLRILCQNTSPDNEERIVKAMFVVSVPAGLVLIRQGEPGDNFYIVQKGSFDIFVAKGGNGKSDTNYTSADDRVMQVGPEGSFGELALMYNAPRAATVVATETSVVWGLDRRSFRMLLVQAGVSKKKKYEELLNRVSIFKCLSKADLCQLSEIMQAQSFAAGETVISQGARGDKFYIVEKGALVCNLRSADGEGGVEVRRYGVGDYFGELALISNYGVRKATVIAVMPSNLLWIGKNTFDRVLGPIVDLLRRNAHLYPSYADLVARSERRSSAAGSRTVTTSRTPSVAVAAPPGN